MLKGRVISCLVLFFIISTNFCVELEAFLSDMPYVRYTCPYNTNQIGYDSVTKDENFCSGLVIDIAYFIRNMAQAYKDNKYSRQRFTENLKKKIEENVPSLFSVHGFSQCSEGISVLTPLQMLLEYKKDSVFDERQEIAEFIVSKLAEQYPLIYTKNLEATLKQDEIIVEHWERFFKAIAATKTIVRSETAL